jgi:predicted amidophosphoribosyltransferase
MQVAGVIALLIGIAVCVYALNMNVTVTTEAQNLGSGVKIPSQTVNNIGLMDDRRNTLIMGGLSVFVGMVLIGVGTLNRKPSDTVQCPYCAEDIRADAGVCRYCGHELSHDDDSSVEVEVESEPRVTFAVDGVCSECHSPLREGAKFCGECGATLSSPPPPAVEAGAACPACRQPAQAGDRFCRECGITLTEQVG